MLDWDLKVWWLALGIDLNQDLVRPLIKVHIDFDLILQLSKLLEDLQPVEVGVVLTEGPRVVVRVRLPLHGLRLVDRFLFERVTCLVRLEGVE